MALDEEHHRSFGGRHRRRRVLDEGEDLSRILALSDGVFAFAMTLLVINLVVPSSQVLAGLAPNGSLDAQLHQYLLNERLTLFAYGLAFFVIASWWMVHHRIFRWVRQYNRPLMQVNFLFLLFIAATPFVVGLLAEYTDSSVAVGAYAGAQSIAGTILVVLLLYLRGPARHLMRPEVTNEMMERGIALAAITPIGFGLSIPLAFVNPYYALFSWLAIFAARAAILREFPEPVTGPLS